jgi:hypothetical protein
MTPTSRTATRAPVRRQRSEQYILLTLLSFAGSVSFTRLFLELTGYPQLGNSELHIAHVLWGGLLLYIATLAPLLFANRWAFTVSALLSGVGMGLFIDEVGKFITQNNNYFYAPAAPIIYAFFLLSVLIYVQVRRRHTQDVRTELYDILNDLEEVIDNDLNEDERNDILEHLQVVGSRTQNTEILELNEAIRKFITSPSLVIVPRTTTPWGRWMAALSAWAERWIKPQRLRAALIGSLAALGVWSLFFPISIIAEFRSPGKLQSTITATVSQGLLRSETTITWFELRLGLEFSIGIILIAAAFFMAANRQARGVQMGYIGLLLLLTTVDLLVFYFDQFTTIINATLQLVVLLGLLYYRFKFLEKR